MGVPTAPTLVNATRKSRNAKLFRVVLIERLNAIQQGFP